MRSVYVKKLLCLVIMSVMAFILLLQSNCVLHEYRINEQCWNILILSCLVPLRTKLLSVEEKDTHVTERLNKSSMILNLN